MQAQLLSGDTGSSNRIVVWDKSYTILKISSCIRLHSPPPLLFFLLFTLSELVDKHGLNSISCILFGSQFLKSPSLSLLWSRSICFFFPLGLFNLCFSHHMDFSPIHCFLGSIARISRMPSILYVMVLNDLSQSDENSRCKLYTCDFYVQRCLMQELWYRNHR